MREIHKVVSLDPPELSLDTYNFLIPLRDNPIIAHNLINRAKKNTHETIKEWIIYRTKEQKEKSLFMVTASTSHTDRQLVGYVTYDIVDAISGVATIGIYITEGESGKGFGKKAIRILIDKLKVQLKIRKIVVEILENNEASKRLFKGLGFREVRILQNHFLSLGRYHNVCILEKLVQ